MLRWDGTNVLPRIDAPVLVLTGSKDIVTLPSASAFIQRSVPHAQLVTIDGCGHMGFMERADAYNEAIAGFADRVLGGATLKPNRAAPT